MVELLFITGNKAKVRQAQKLLKNYEIKLIQKRLSTPEIQDTDCCKIAEFSAKYACERIEKPVVVTDAGYYIRALNGFPGPFIKFINNWFTPEDLLRLMGNKKDRSVISPVCVAYCKPGRSPVSFLSKNLGTISFKPQGKGSTIDKLFIPKGYKGPIATLPQKDQLSLWSKNCWVQLAEYLRKD